MIELALAVFAALFSVVNPLGAVPVFLALTPDFTAKERKKTSLHTAVYFVFILLCFFIAGTTILGFFGITLNSLRIAGGIIIFGSGASLINNRMAKSRSINSEVRAEALEKEDISFTPLAMPLLAGPGSISLMITYFSENEGWTERLIIIATLLVVGVVVFLILRGAPYLFRVLGVAGIRAISRIMGFLVMAIAVEMIVTSIKHIL